MKMSGSTAHYETLTGHDAPVTAIAFSPDGLEVVTGDTDRIALIHRSNGEKHSIDLKSESMKVRPTERMRSIAFSADGNQFFVTASDSLQAFWTDTGEETWRHTPNRLFGFLIVSPLRLAVSRDGMLAVCYDNASLGVWSSFGERKTMWRDSEAPHWLGWLPDGERIVGADTDHVSVWDSRLHAKMARWSSEDRIYGMAVHPSDSTVAIRTLHGHRILNVENGEEIGAFEASRGLPLSAFRPGYKLLAISEERGIAVVNYSGQVQVALGLDEGLRPTGLTWSADGQRLAVGCSDGTVRIYSVA